MPGVGKKADAVADRSGVPLLYAPCLSPSGLPPRRERRFAFPGSEVFGAGTLPVGFQGRSALVAPKGAKSRFKKLAHSVLLHFGVLAGYALAILVMIAGFIVTCGTHDSGGSEAEASMNTAYAVLLVLIPAVLNGGGLALAIDWSRWIEWT